VHAHLAIPCGRFQVPYTNVHPFIPCKYLECCRSGSVVKETLTHAAERTYRLKPFVEKTVKLLRPIAKLRFYTSQEKKKRKKRKKKSPLGTPTNQFVFRNSTTLSLPSRPKELFLQHKRAVDPSYFPWPSSCFSSPLQKARDIPFCDAYTQK